jgi:heme A synthase
LIVAQAISGALVVLTQLDIFATMSHGMFVSLYFGTLAYMCMKVLPRPESARQLSSTVEPASSKSPAPAVSAQ